MIILPRAPRAPSRTALRPSACRARASLAACALAAGGLAALDPATAATVRIVPPTGPVDAAASPVAIDRAATDRAAIDRAALAALAAPAPTVSTRVPAAPPTVAPDALGRAVDALAPALRSPSEVRALYAARGHRPAWTSPESVRTLRAALAGARADGLVPDRIAPPAGEPDPFGPPSAFAGTAVAGTAAAGSARVAAERDVRLSDVLLTLLDRLRRGTTDPGPVAVPGDDSAPLGRTPLDPAAAARLSARLDVGDVVGAVRAVRPATPLYAGLRDALARHLEALDGPGLPPRLGRGPTLEPGTGGARTERLRRRLAALDALDGLHGTDRFAAAERLANPAARVGRAGEPFGPALEGAVRAFQERHGLEVDGKVGRLTRGAIDMGLDGRIERLRVNLERARHIALALGDEDRVVVNVADQRLTLELDGRTTWETDVVVGQTKHRTPVHVGEIEWIELDPRWTVPRRIVLDTLYARAKADPVAFANEGFVLRDLGGVWTDPREIDWDTMTPERFHYDVVQRPGPRNPLGRAKFMFPNRYAVYLHDTPNRSLFEEDRRAFSRGCVRVQHADTLAALLLEHRNGERRPDVVTLRAAADEVRIDLERPLLVALLYWTAEVDEHGRLRLIDDLYGRDAAAAAELDAATS